MMTLRQIRHFIAVAETGSLSAAARDLGLSQPTLGRHIADLEAQLQGDAIGMAIGFGFSSSARLDASK